MNTFKLSLTNNFIESIQKLKFNLKLLYVLNLFDLLFTKALLHFGDGLFIEANNFLNPIIHGFIPYILKIILFAGVLYYWYKRSFKSTEKQLKRSIAFARICVIAYVAIDLFHIGYAFLLIYLNLLL